MAEGDNETAKAPPSRLEKGISDLKKIITPRVVIPLSLIFLVLGAIERSPSRIILGVIVAVFPLLLAPVTRLLQRYVASRSDLSPIAEFKIRLDQATNSHDRSELLHRHEQFQQESSQPIQPTELLLPAQAVVKTRQRQSQTILRR